MQTTENKLTGLKSLQNAATRQDVERILNNFDQPPSSLLAQEISSEKKKKGFKIFLLVMATIAIAAVTIFAYIGGGYIAEYVGPVALIFGALDVTIVILLFLDAVKGKLRFMLVTFEIASLLYLGYATGGYFGGGNIRTAAEKMLTADYAVAKDHYASAQATVDLMNRAIQNASSVKDVEAARDGKGVVFEKASFIASMKASSLLTLPSLPQVSSFKDLTSANKWLQSERQKVVDYITKCDAEADAMRNQAKSTEQSLRDAMKMGLSQQQLSNLQVLASSMQEIANKQQVTDKVGKEVLRPSDLKADGFQNFIGYIIDLVIIFFIVLLALQRSSEKKIEEIKNQETRAMMDSILSDDGIHFDAALVEGIPIQRQIEAFKVLYASETLLKYVKSKISFDEYLQFFKDYPVLARKLGGTTWLLAEIKKELERNSSFANIAESAIQLTPGDWKLLNTATKNPEDLFRMEEEAQAKFIKVLKQISAKTKLRTDELRTFMSQFLLIESPGENFMINLENCAGKLSADRLDSITPDFINTTTPVVAKFLCETVTNPRQFGKIVSGWNLTLDTSLNNILNDGIVSEEGFDRLMKVVLDMGGIDGLKKFTKAYTEKKREADTGGIGNKVLELKPDFAKIKTALTGNNDTDFLQAISDAIRVKNSSADV